jgi:uncharacterized membrane protein YphA (DoxX/SURF4 family)/peroxiredoxin
VWAHDPVFLSVLSVLAQESEALVRRTRRATVRFRREKSNGRIKQLGLGGADHGTDTVHLEALLNGPFLDHLGHRRDGISERGRRSVAGDACSYHAGMNTAALAVRLALAAVFLLAGLGKLLDRRGAERALQEFGIPVRLTAFAAIALPLAELAIAAALVFPASATGGAITASVLLVAFMIAIANALFHDRAPDCHCFGRIHSAPAGKGTLARNGGLLLLAVFVSAVGPGPAIDGWASHRTPAVIALGAAVSAGLVLASSSDYWLERRRSKRAEARVAELRRRSGVPVGSPAPQFELPGACGPPLGLDSLRARANPVMVVFADPGCCECRQLFPHVGRWQEALATRLTIVLISNDDVLTSRVLCDTYGISNVLLQSDFAVLDAYRMPATPSAVIVDRDGSIASDTATGYLMIHALVRLALRRTATRSEPWELSTQPA